MRRTTIVILTVALTAAGFALAQGFGNGHGRGHGRPGMGPGGAGRGRGGDCIIEALGLSAEQRTAVAGLRDQQRATVQPLRDQARQLQEQIRTMLDSGQATAQGVGELVLQEHAVRGQIRTAHDTFEAAVRALLTPEQQQLFDALRRLRSCRGGPDGDDGGPGMGFGPGAGAGWGRGHGSGT
jgi:Spy/CpxP family protein refolding chaperone